MRDYLMLRRAASPWQMLHDSLGFVYAHVNRRNRADFGTVLNLFGLAYVDVVSNCVYQSDQLLVVVSAFGQDASD